MAFGCKPKVDCDRLETRLITCLKENYKTFNPTGCPAGAEECVKVMEKLTTDYAKIVDSEIVGPCKAKSGRDSRSAKINKCLEQKECKDVHACLKEVTR
jgi:hypothetical protein